MTRTYTRGVSHKPPSPTNKPALSIQPESPGRLYFAGRAALLNGDATVARERLTEIDELLPELRSHAGWIYRDALQAELWLHGADPAAAVPLLEGVLGSGLLLEDFSVDWSTGTPLFLDALARAHEASGNRAAAAATLEMSIGATFERLNHPVPNVMAYYKLGLLYDQLGDNVASRRNLESFLQYWGAAEWQLAEVEDARRRLGM